MSKRHNRLFTLFWVGLYVVVAPAQQPSAEPSGDSQEILAEIGGEPFQVYTYHPEGCSAPSLLLVFHGNGRGAESYRNAARDLADRACFVVYAPLFDEDRFPNWSYHRGGVARRGEIQPSEEWTVNLVDDFIEWAREQEGRPDAPSYLFGHSAGGQFLSRVAAYALPPDVERIVIANPSTYVVPDLEEDAPYGFDRLPEDMDPSDLLRDYLAAPVTIFVGLKDTGDEDLTQNDAARRQGENRLERGRQVFEEARDLAEENGWPFGWRLVEAEGVGHSARQVLRSGDMTDALDSLPAE